jgi:hypothetical protein
MATLCLPGTAWCTEGDAAEISGFLSGYYASGDRKLDDRHSFIGTNDALQIKLKPGPKLTLYVDGRYFSNNPDLDNNVKEAYINWDLDRFSLRAGKQVIAWGRADKFNPTDVITPRNYEILSSDDDDQRFGAIGVMAKIFVLPELSLEAVLLPTFRSGRVPSGIFPPQILQNREHNGYSLDNTQWGIRLDKSGGQLDWSVSYYNGFSTLPMITLGNGFDLVLRNPRMQMFGMDFATTLDQWGIRGEGAYVRLSGLGTIPQTAPQSYFYSVLGIERNLAESMNLNIQWLHQNVFNFTERRDLVSPLVTIANGNSLIFNQFDSRQDGITVRLSEKWLNDTLQAEITGACLFNHGDYVIRPKVQYAISDRWKAALLADFYRGPHDSFFGGFRKNSLAYLEIRYEFGPFSR